MADSQIKQSCRKLVDVRKNCLVGLILPSDSIQPSHLLKVQECLESKSFENLDIVLHSGGGDINSAYQIAQLLHLRAKNVSVIVPLFAKSAATLLTISASEIIMGEIAELGPLDTQVLERQKGGRKYNSALNPFKSLEQLQSFSLETLDYAVKLFLNRSSLTVDEAIARAIEFAASTASPLYSKLDIEKLGEYSRALSVGKEYGDRLLRRYTELGKNDDERSSLLDKLVRGYPSHDYIIDFLEMKDLGFNVRQPNQTEKPIIHEIACLLTKVQPTELFCLCNKAEDTEDKKGQG
jgi:hypothetical protein